MKDPGIPRATKAVTVEKPDGNLDSPDNRTVMQQHVDFFDFDKDGVPCSMCSTVQNSGGAQAEQGKPEMDQEGCSTVPLLYMLRACTRLHTSQDKASSHDSAHLPERLIEGVAACTGIIYPRDTYIGFRKIGFNVFLSAYAVLVIHGTFSYPSQVIASSLFPLVFSVHARTGGLALSLVRPPQEK